jgi:hypothetical protein
LTGFPIVSATNGRYYTIINRRLSGKGGNALKIKEFAEGKKVSPQAVYKALNRSGFSAKTLTDRSGNLTRKGMTVLNRLFPSAGDQVEPEQPEPVNQADQAESIIAELRNQVSELTERCNEWESRYFEAVKHGNQEKEQLRILLQREQELRLYAENKGFFKRLFAGRKDKEQ